MNIRRHLGRLRASTVIASLALFVALGGSATAATLITGAKIKDGSVTGKDLKNSAVTGAKVKGGSLSASDLSKSVKGSLKGARGDAGQAGGPGTPGAPGPNGVKAPQTSTQILSNVLGNVGDRDIMEKAVPPGQYMVSVKGYLFANDVSHMTCRLFNGANVADQIDWDSTSGVGLRFPARLVAVVNVTSGPLTLRCQKSGAAAGTFSAGQLIAIPTS